MALPGPLPVRAIHPPLPWSCGCRCIDGASCERGIYQVALEKFDVIEVIKIAALAGSEIVSDADTMVSSHQFFCEMRSDETGAACHEVGSHSYGC